MKRVRYLSASFSVILPRAVALGMLGLLLTFMHSATAFHAPIHDLAVTPADLTVLGATPGIQLGLSVATGDFNGDDIDDLVTGEVGRVYVIFGSVALGGTIDLAITSPDLTILAADAGDNLGRFASSGDFNGDGIDDLLLGANLADGPGNTKDEAGEVYVIFGSTSLGGTIDLATTSPDLTVVGHHQLSRAKVDPGPAFDWERVLRDVAAARGETPPP